MKKSLAILCISTLSYSSCKKDRVCNCSISTSGNTTTRTQSPGIPPIVAQIDTITVSPINTIGTYSATYTKVSKKAMRSSCKTKSDETFNNTSVTNIPGIFTLTTTDAGVKSYTCKIE